MSGSGAICCRVPKYLSRPCLEPVLPRDMAREGGGIIRPVVSEYWVLGLSGTPGAWGFCGASSSVPKPMAFVNC